MPDIQSKMTGNPVIGVDMAHYALLLNDPPFSESDPEAPEYGEPVALPNAKGITVTSSDSATTEYYDNAPKITVASKSDRTINFVRAAFSNAELKVLLGLASMDGIIIEGGKSNPPYLAFGFRRLKVGNHYDYVWYLKGIMYMNELAAATREQNVTMQNRTMVGTFIVRACDDQIYIQASTDDPDVDPQVFEDWFKAETLNKLYLEAVSPAPGGGDDKAAKAASGLSGD